MSNAWDTEPHYVNIGDSAEIYAYIKDDNDVLVPQASLSSVSFAIRDPNGNLTTQAGTITAAGTGYTRFLSTTYDGEYQVVATFTFASGQIKSSLANFEVINPLDPPAPSALQVLGNLVWRKIEDCFDAEEEGPWLRDMTLNVFDKSKMQEFISEGLFDLNHQNPPTTLNETYFVNNGVATPDAPVIVQATFLAVILHLMASYTEQATPTGGQVVYEDRRDYLQRWSQIYEIEMQKYLRWAALFKRQFLGLGHSKSLIGNKAGRLIGAPLRSSNIGRGWY